MRGAIGLALLAVVTVASAVALPICVERRDESWQRFRGERAGSPLLREERIYQLDTDQPAWLEVIADFPDYYRRDPDRINRPLYPAVATLPARALGALGIAPVRAAYVVGVVLNLLIFLAAVWGFHRFLLVIGLETFEAWLAAALLALTPYVAWMLPVASSTTLTIGMAVAALWIFRVVVRGRMGGALAVGAAAGLLMLGKAHYDIMAAGWAIAVRRGAWRRSLACFAAHVVPLAAWVAIAGALGMSYRIAELEEYGQGVWFLMTPAADVMAEVPRHVGQWLVALVAAFGPVTLAAAVVGAVVLRRRGQLPLADVGLAVASSVVFLFAIKRPLPYYVLLLFVVVYPLAAVGAAALARGRRWVCGAFLAAVVISAWASLWLLRESERFAVRQPRPVAQAAP